MSKKFKKLAAFLAVLLVFQMLFASFPQQVNAAGNTFYVSTNGSDSNPGTIDAPFLTIQKGIDMASAGDTVYIRGGRYLVTDMIRFHKSGTSGNPITLAAYEGETPIIDGQDAYPNDNLQEYEFNGNTYVHSWNALIEIEGSHIVVDGLEVTGSFGKGIEVGITEGHLPGHVRHSNVIVKNCNIHDNRHTALEFEYMDDSLADNNKIWRNAMFAPFSRSPSQVNWPVALLLATCRNTIVQNCEVYNNWTEGIGIWSNFRTPDQISEYVTIQDNEVYDNYAVEIYADHAAYLTIQRNLVYNTGDTTYYRDGKPCAGILFSDEDYGENTTPPGHHRTIINNLTIGNSSNIAYWYQGVEGSALNNDIIAHNTSVDAYGEGLYIAEAEHKNSRIENNIFIQSNGGQLVDVEQDPELHFSHNNWSSPVTGAASNVNDIIADPKLVGGDFSVVGEDYFKLQDSSPVINKGKLLLDVVGSDYFGVERSALPTMGAVENLSKADKILYVSTEGNDANTGTNEQPYKTIQKALNVSVPGTTILIKGGTYIPSDSISVTTSGTAQAPITIMPFPGESPVIDGKNTLPTAAGKGLINIKASFIEMKGLEVKNSNGAGVVIGRDASIENIKIAQFNIHDNKAEGILLSSVNNFEIVGSKVSNNGTSGQMGILVSNASEGILEKSEIFNNAGQGIGLSGTNNISLQDNTVYNNSGAGIYLDTAAGIQIQRNMIYANGDGILVEDRDNKNAVGHDRTIINNLFKGNGSNIVFKNTGRKDSGLKEDLIANNTLVDAAVAGMVIAAGDHSNVRIENNIVKQSAGDILIVDQDPELHFSYNNWSDEVTGIALNENDVIRDPALKEGDFGVDYFTLKPESPCLDAGKEIAEVTEDFVKKLRGIPPCMGALESNLMPMKMGFYEAENYTEMGNAPGGTVYSNENIGASGGKYVGSMPKDGYLMFENVRLNDVAFIKAKTATAYANTKLDFRIDSPSGQLLGTLDIPVTNWAGVGGENWRELTLTLEPIRGTYDLYVVFSGEKGSPDLDWIDLVLDESGKIINPGYETGDLTGWTVESTADWAYGAGNGGTSGDYKFWTWHSEPYELRISQTVTGLVDGNYTVNLMANAGNNPELSRLEVSDYGGSMVYTPVNTTSFEKYSQTVDVTSGQITMAFYIKGRATSWSNLDDWELVLNKVYEPEPLITRDGKTSTVSLEVKAQMDPETDAAIARVEERIVAALYKKAKEEEASGQKAVIELMVKPLEDAKAVEVKIPGDAFKEMAASTNADIKVDTVIGSITFNAKSLDSLNESASTGDFCISIRKVEKAELTKEAQTKVGDRPVYDLSTQIGNIEISDFGNGKATLWVPYTPKIGEKKNSIEVYYIDNTGKLQTVRGKYDPTTRMVKLTVSHF